MTHELLHQRLTPAQYEALKDAARARAVELRGEAFGAAWQWLLRQGRRGGSALAATWRPPQAVARNGGPAR